jgi:hypothetical protein
MFQCLDKRRDGDSACNLRDCPWALRDFGDRIRATADSVTTAQKLVIKNRIGFTRGKYPGFVAQFLKRNFVRCRPLMPMPTSNVLSLRLTNSVLILHVRLCDYDA